MLAGAPKSDTISVVADDNSTIRHRSQRRLAGAPRGSRLRKSSEIEFDPATKRALEEKLSLIDQAQAEAYQTGRDYLVS